MANSIEILVAKERRACCPLEQREIALGFAELSTHEEMHQRIFEKGGSKL